MALPALGLALMTKQKDDGMSTTNQVDLIFRYRIKSGQEAGFQNYLDKILPVVEAEEPYVISLLEKRILHPSRKRSL